MKSLVKKIIVLVMVLLSTTAVFSINNPTPAYADSTDIGSCRYFLGMTSWDCGINPSPKSDKEIKENTEKIIVNIFVDVGTIAMYLAVGYIIYGGYLYILASGDPTKNLTARKTIIRACIGLAIVMLANVILNSIRIAMLGKGSDFSCNLQTGAGCDNNASTLVKNLINWFIGTSSIVAVIFIVIGGFGYMTANGDPGKLSRAKTTIIYAAIGMIVATLSMAIFNFVYDAVNKNSDFEQYNDNKQSSLIIEAPPIAKK